MRRAGYATVDALVARLASPGPTRCYAAPMPSACAPRPPPEQPGDYGAVLARPVADVRRSDTRRTWRYDWHRRLAL
jgi:hypothetical protein